MKLWRSLKMREAELKSRGEMAGEALIAMATDIIRLEIKDQLGHVDVATTHRYIRWVARQLSVALPTTYAKYMQAADDAADDAEDH
jgi:integrase